VTQDLTALAYLVSAICFIMALRGLSSPETSRGGNRFGIAGMVIAIATTLAQPGVVSYPIIAAGIVIGGAIGSFIALRIKMTALPQLVAAFHSLVGLAAVCVAAAAYFSPHEFGIGEVGAIERHSLIEMGLGVAMRHHLHGSIVAFAKLRAGDRGAAGLLGPASLERCWAFSSSPSSSGSSSPRTRPPSGSWSCSPCCWDSCSSCPSAAPTCRWWSRC
jgi:NAD(P) transhydrogenase subunit beta